MVGAYYTKAKIVRQVAKKKAESAAKRVSTKTKALKASVRSAKSLRGVVDVTEKLSKLGDRALIAYDICKRDWDSLWKDYSSFAFGVVVGGFCTFATGGTLVVGCFAVGVLASAALDNQTE